ncbi:uncharacterized protein LOC110094177 [Dendrobium catenatum]|uniref:uncharacterized protein LOC110094177 n=1 Tax=Dendrobium catenatum TaxID=906689 RepID=UPI0010A06DA8|nr:uncharacterized protein LOC110094177 [Dendrobium catenatum]
MTLPLIGCWNVRGFNSPDKVFSCKNLVASHHLDMICILEAKTPSMALSDPWFQKSHQIFNDELNCNNASPISIGRIWIKWNPNATSFSPLSISQHLFHGTVSLKDSTQFFMTVVYAGNTPSDRVPMWNQLQNIASNLTSPWIIMGDFNCYISTQDKMGGLTPTPSQLNEMNSWVFETVEAPGCSDHSPLILLNGNAKQAGGRFRFKNFWINMYGFWDCVVSAFANHKNASHIANLYHKLRILKHILKKQTWASSSFIKDNMVRLEKDQKNCLQLIDSNPLDPCLNAHLKRINSLLSYYNSAWCSWTIQCAKAKWLSQGEDDLGFLYAKIKNRGNINRIKEITTSEGHFSTLDDVGSAIISHFKTIFNSPNPLNASLDSIPIGNTMPPQFFESLTRPITDPEMKQVIFDGALNSSPGPDGYTFEFYKSTWDITGSYVCQAIRNYFRTGLKLQPLF